ncbi:hypothetical protein GGI19_006453, partial [Coemansia pectinata]
EDYDNDDLHLVPKASMDTFLCDVMANAQIVVSGTAGIAKYLAAASQPQHDFKNIKLLDTSDAPLSLYGVLCLLKALPSLEKIKCDISGLGSELAH